VLNVGGSPDAAGVIQRHLANHPALGTHNDETVERISQVIVHYPYFL
jgi:hypothetical protein